MAEVMFSMTMELWPTPCIEWPSLDGYMFDKTYTELNLVAWLIFTKFKE